jgi:hypothetical protein
VVNRVSTINSLVADMDFDFSTIGKKKHIGSLGFVEEAAGKVRVFAMVDCWTQ